MNIKAIITTLVLGTSSAAIADTYGQPAPEPYPMWQGDHDDHDDMRGWRRGMMLAQDVRLNGYDQRPTYVRFDRLGNARMIRFDAERGRTFIDTVIVTFADGHHQTMSVRQMLSWRNPSITLELPHGGVTGMWIYGSSMRGRGSFDIIAIRNFARRDHR